MIQGTPREANSLSPVPSAARPSRTARLMLFSFTGRFPALPGAGIGHAGPGLGGRQRFAVLQQLDRDAVRRANKGHAAVARRTIDRDTVGDKGVASVVDVFHGVGEMPEIAAAGIGLRIPIVGEFHRGFLVTGGGEKHVGVSPFLVRAAANLLEAQYFEEGESVLKRTDADHGVQIFGHGGILRSAGHGGAATVRGETINRKGADRSDHARALSMTRALTCLRPFDGGRVARLSLEGQTLTAAAISRGRAEPEPAAAGAAAGPELPSARAAAQEPEPERTRRRAPRKPAGRPTPHYATACGGAFY